MSTNHPFPNTWAIELMSDDALLTEQHSLRTWLQEVDKHKDEPVLPGMELALSSIPGSLISAEVAQRELVRKVSIRLAHIQNELSARLASVQEDELDEDDSDE